LPWFNSGVLGGGYEFLGTQEVGSALCNVFYHLLPWCVFVRSSCFEDFGKMSASSNGRPSGSSVFQSLFFGRASERVRTLIYLIQHARQKRQLRLARFCSRWLERYGIYISSESVIGNGLRLPHPTSIVI